ncbi:DUF3768 domain-containing protein [Nostoc sp.]|uniref:DUF3768 domain-containing protein n=1 Tax=Nostoc sp. TaxID=1180 RepID=UPI003FA5401B
MYWKIDYFDKKIEYRSENPADSSVTIPISNRLTHETLRFLASVVTTNNPQQCSARADRLEILYEVRHYWFRQHWYRARTHLRA